MSKSLIQNNGTIEPTQTRINTKKQPHNEAVLLNGGANASSIELFASEIYTIFNNSDIDNIIFLIQNQRKIA